MPNIEISESNSTESKAEGKIILSFDSAMPISNLLALEMYLNSGKFMREIYDEFGIVARFHIGCGRGEQ